MKQTKSGMSPDNCCNGKVRFESFKRAQATASRSAHSKEDQMGAYHCVYCHGYHVAGHALKNRLRDKKPALSPQDRRKLDADGFDFHYMDAGERDYCREDALREQARQFPRKDEGC